MEMQHCAKPGNIASSLCCFLSCEAAALLRCAADRVSHGWTTPAVRLLTAAAPLALIPAWPLRVASVGSEPGPDPPVTQRMASPRRGFPFHLPRMHVEGFPRPAPSNIARGCSVCRGSSICACWRWLLTSSRQ